MYCKNCGTQIDDNASVCIHCGAAVKPMYEQPPQQVPVESNTIATVGFILSFFVALVGLICSIIGLKRSKELNGNGRGLAIAGIVISSVEIFIVVLLLILFGGTIIALITGAADALAFM